MKNLWANNPLHQKMPVGLGRQFTHTRAYICHFGFCLYQAISKIVLHLFKIPIQTTFPSNLFKNISSPRVQFEFPKNGIVSSVFSVSVTT